MFPKTGAVGGPGGRLGSLEPALLSLRIAHTKKARRPPKTTVEGMVRGRQNQEGRKGEGDVR